MTSNPTAVHEFYAAVARADAPGALCLMADDIEWIGMPGWPYKTTERGPASVAENILAPMLADWRDLAITPHTFLYAGDSVVALGRYTGIQAVTGKPLAADFAHVWDVVGGRLARFRQFTDTLLVDRARQ